MSNEDYIGIALLNKLIIDNHLDKNTVTLESLLKVIIDKIRAYKSTSTSN